MDTVFIYLVSVLTQVVIENVFGYKSEYNFTNELGCVSVDNTVGTCVEISKCTNVGKIFKLF